MNRTDIHEKISDYIAQRLLQGKVSIGTDTALYSSGLLSSMAHLKLMNFLERTYQVSIPGYRVNLESFDTLNQIAGLVAELVQEKPGERVC